MTPDENSSMRKKDDIALEKYSNPGLKWGRKKNIIIDLRSLYTECFSAGTPVERVLNKRFSV